jgi:hypothetical protein
MIRLIVEQVATDRQAGLTMTRIVPTGSVVCIVEAVTQ